MKILILNSGSSSLKTCLYEIGEALPADPPACLWECRIEWIGEDAAVQLKNSGGAGRQYRIEGLARAEVLKQSLRAAWSGETQSIVSASEIDVVGHRVVHGGPRYAEPVLITPDVKSAITAASEFAPLHSGAEIEGMEIVENLLGPVPQVAVFDTGFHRTMPLAAAVYPGPYEWFERGIRRYGFHGVNHQYCATRAAALLSRDPASLKLVTCHLGAGCSLAAINGGRSLDTTMGFTPLDGLMMGTRSGSVDPGILTYLTRRDRLQAREIDEMLNKQSGLLGVSGVSDDMREILAALKQGDQRARLAFDIFTHRLRAGIGAMTAVLGGIDALVFTAGVGENSHETRSAACDKLVFLGIKLDETANARVSADEDISAQDSLVRILVIRAREDWVIAEECWKLTASKRRV
ncbi:MAG: acetate kinase [Chloracidobacterium sp.]|nr:acetate kinase [Chloracidobacterium sp.]